MGERAVGNRILAYPRGERRFFRLFAGSGLALPAGHPFVPPAVPVYASVGVGRYPAPPAECGRGEPPPTGVLCGLLSPQCQRARWIATPAGGRMARPVDAPIAIAWIGGVVIRPMSRVAAVGSSCSVSCMAICPSVDACNAHGC
jgi:hypothetical protein